MQRAALFLDRDGVINQAVFNPNTGEFESPHTVDDLQLFPGVPEALLDLQKRFLLFIVSNQPSYAKGKCSLETLKAIGERVETLLADRGVKIQKSYYCYHHPASIVPELKGPCLCRKPGNQSLLNAAKEYGIDFSQSWMLGDRDSDIFCGQSVGCRTVLIEDPHSQNQRGKSSPTLKASGLLEAARAILTL